MATINTTLNSFWSPGLKGDTPPFGKKKVTGKGLSTQEITDNERMPFMRERPFVVSENSGTTVIEANSVFSIAAETSITLTLGEGDFVGCDVLVVNPTGINHTIKGKIDSTSTEALAPIPAYEHRCFKWRGDRWDSVVIVLDASISPHYTWSGKYIKEQMDALSSRINTEASTRLNADNALSSRITSNDTDIAAIKTNITQFQLHRNYATFTGKIWEGGQAIYRMCYEGYPSNRAFLMELGGNRTPVNITTSGPNGSGSWHMGGANNTPGVYYSQTNGQVIAWNNDSAYHGKRMLVVVEYY